MGFRIKSYNAINLLCRTYCQAPSCKDPAPFFFSRRVQDLMFQLNDKQHDKVFKPRKLGQKLETPQYVFMTDDDLNKERQRLSNKLRDKLQVPPILAARRPIERVLAAHPVLAGANDSKLVCIDISADIPDRKRLICVREPDGTLRTASWEERSRMCQIFIPVPGRNVVPSKMFEEPHLKACLDREDYEMVLDRAALQYQPDDPEYLRVTSTAYEHIDSTRLFDRLQSTRHFGALAFYLAWHRRCDNLLLQFIQLAKLDKAVHLISLFRTLRLSEPTSDEAPPSQPAVGQSESDSSTDSDSSEADQDTEAAHIETIQEYIDTESVKRSVLELALQKYKQLAAQRDAADRVKLAGRSQ